MVIQIQDRFIGNGHPCFIIAEAGVNHNGSLEMALKLVDVAVQAGADAVKFQTFKAERLVTKMAPKAEYQKETTGAGESQLEMLRRLELSTQDHVHLKQYCAEKGILFMSTPFDEQSADFLDELGVSIFKLGSGEVTNLPYLRHVARKMKPLILSTGMSFLSEVDVAVRAISETQNTQLVLLHCVSNYPTSPADANLRAIQTMSTAFQIPVGYSDHTMGYEVPLAAAALGACVIEKHFTLDRTLPGPDQPASLEPGELAGMVKGIRTVESALGHGKKIPAPSEAPIAAVARRSLVASRTIPPGALITAESVAIQRPGTGMAPEFYSFVVGKKARVEIQAGTLLSFEMLEL